jgi:carbonic anhydrase
MTGPFLSRIRSLQTSLYARHGFSDANPPVLGGNDAPVHKPEMLLIGCVDARLDPKTDIGFPTGSALIYRNIAALVAGRDSGAGDQLSAAAALEFAVNRMNVQKIIVMGHTACGGIRAFVEGDHDGTHYISDYLKPLEGVRIEAKSKGADEEQQARNMEKAAVIFSLENLMTYDVVRDAVAAGKVKLHGWVLDTGNRLIWEMDPETKEFRPMGEPLSQVGKKVKV